MLSKGEVERAGGGVGGSLWDPAVRLPGTDLVCTRTQRCEKKSASASLPGGKFSHTKAKMNKAAERQTVQSPGEGPGRMACLPPAEEEKCTGASGAPEARAWVATV